MKACIGCIAGGVGGGGWGWGGGAWGVGGGGYDDPVPSGKQR